MKHDEVVQGLADAMEREVKPHLVREHEEVVSNWNNKPAFEARKYVGPEALRITVHATGHNKQIWNWVNEGTGGKGVGRTYTITAKRAPMLAFQLGYVPKTAPGGGYGGAGAATGPWVRARSVQHPGIKPREFPKHIARKNEAWYSRTMENAWRRVLRSL